MANGKMRTFQVSDLLAMRTVVRRGRVGFDLTGPVLEGALVRLEPLEHRHEFLDLVRLLTREDIDYVIVAPNGMGMGLQGATRPVARQGGFELRRR